MATTDVYPDHDPPPSYNEAVALTGYQIPTSTTPSLLPQVSTPPSAGVATTELYGTNHPLASGVTNPASAGTNHPPARAVSNLASAGTAYLPPVANNPGDRPTLGPNPKFNMTVYIQLCTGIGKWYCVLCACWYVLCLGGGGIGMIVLASLIWADSDPYSPRYCSPISTAVLSILAGGACILLCVFWCITLVVFTKSGSNGHSNPFRRIDLDDNRNYTLLNCCFWMVIIFFVSVTTGIAVDAFNVNYYGISKPIAITMGCIIGLFLCCNLLTYRFIRKEAGQICFF